MMVSIFFGGTACWKWIRWRNLALVFFAHVLLLDRWWLSAVFCYHWEGWLHVQRTGDEENDQTREMISTSKIRHKQLAVKCAYWVQCQTEWTTRIEHLKMRRILIHPIVKDTLETENGQENGRQLGSVLIGKLFACTPTL